MRPCAGAGLGPVPDIEEVVSRSARRLERVVVVQEDPIGACAARLPHRDAFELRIAPPRLGVCPLCHALLRSSVRADSASSRRSGPRECRESTDSNQGHSHSTPGWRLAASRPATALPVAQDASHEGSNGWSIVVGALAGAWIGAHSGDCDSGYQLPNVRSMLLGAHIGDWLVSLVPTR